MTGSILRFVACSESLIECARNAILRHFDGNNGTVSKGKVLNLQNKYFEADIACLDVKDSSFHNWIEDGIIMVFSDESSLAFDAIKDLVEQLLSENVGDTLRLCMSIKSDNKTGVQTNKNEYESEYSRRVLWCLDYGFEYVEKCDLSVKGVTLGHDEREKEGFARVIEAVSSTIWSSAKKQPKKTSSSISDVGADQVDNIARSGAIHNVIDGEFNIVDVQKSQETKERSQEEAMDDLERLMKEARSIREEAKGGNIPDSIRRQRAEDTALKLMELFDSLDFEEDNGESSDENSDCN